MTNENKTTPRTEYAPQSSKMPPRNDESMKNEPNQHPPSQKHAKGQFYAKRTVQQNRAMHLFFTRLAQSLNDAGLDQRKVLKPSVSIPWTPSAVKENLWRPIQRAMTQKHSTKELKKREEITEIHATLMRHLAEKFGVEYIPFPSHPPGYWDTAPLKSPLTPVAREKTNV